MAARRKVGSMLGLAVLSTLVAEPMHPYEIASTLRARGKDRDMPIKWGSLYTVVRNLEKYGFIEVAGSDRRGARPERTVYRITEAGRAELEDWVRELIGVPERELPRFKAGLSVMAALPPDEVIELLRNRLDALETRLAEDKSELDAITDIPRILLVEAEYDLAVLEAEARWVRSLLAEMTEGTLPGLKEWRAYRESGELPAELVELDERTRREKH